MQAAASRAATAERRRRTDNPSATPHLAIADDTGLLDALPIAAAVIERGPDRSFKVAVHNSRFLELVEAMPAPDVGRAAVEVGYSDQPHLTRESTALTGLSPVALLDSRLTRALADGVRRR